MWLVAHHRDWGTPSEKQGGVFVNTGEGMVGDERQHCGQLGEECGEPEKLPGVHESSQIGGCTALERGLG